MDIKAHSTKGIYYQHFYNDIKFPISVETIVVVNFVQRDYIWRNFATLGKKFKAFGNLFDNLFRIGQNVKAALVKKMFGIVLNGNY